MIGPNTFFPFLETLHWCTNFFTSCQMRSCRPFSILYFKQKWFLTFFCIWFLKLFCTCCPKKKIGFRNVALFSLRGVVAVELKVFLGDEHNYTITGHMSPFCIHLCEPPLISLHNSHSRVERQTWEENSQQDSLKTTFYNIISLESNFFCSVPWKYFILKILNFN